jgi:hypothetical protein
MDISESYLLKKKELWPVSDRATRAAPQDTEKIL